MNLDDRAIHEANMRRSVEDKLKDVSPDEIFAVITQSGRELFLPLLEDMVRKVVTEVFEEKLQGHKQVIRDRNRQDSWTSSEDATLYEIVNDHVRRGSTKQLAYAEASRLLGRTKMACGYRWNHHLSKDFTV